MRPHLILTALVLMLGLAGAAPALAQDATPRTPVDQRGTAPGNLTFGPMAGAPVMQFIFETNKDTKIGTAVFGWMTGQEQFQLTVGGPLTEGSTEPLTLDGLAAGATARLSWNHLRKSGPSRADRREIIAMCKPIQEEKKKAAVALWEKDQSQPSPPQDLAQYPCFSSDFTSLEDRADFDDLQHLYAPALLFGLDSAVARTKFRFLDGALTDQSEEHVGGNFTVRVGVVAPAFVSVYASYKWTETHKAGGDPSNICSPIDNTTSTKCRQAVLGAPSALSRSILSLEMRRFFGPRVAISPSVQVDFKNDAVAEVAVPIYFIGSGTNATGGVRFNWRSDKRELTAVVFIGATIGLLPG